MMMNDVAADWQRELDVAWQRLQDAEPDLDWQPYKVALTEAFIRSDFLKNSVLAAPKTCFEWLESGSLDQPLEAAKMAEEVRHYVLQADDEPSLFQYLRKAKQYYQFHIIWRDLLGLAALEEVLAATTVLAETLIITARDVLYQQLTERWGTPVNEQGEPQSLLILGMGKLGGHELNVSSDVDLIFVFPESGYTTGHRRSRENQQFFERLGQRLIQALEQRTAHGQVYRVDMRLRPFGASGPLVLNFAALEDYYQEQGRDWERYAMLKARPLGPETAATKALTSLLRPFVYRRYLDFSAIDSLRRMKQLIRQEVRRRQWQNNIKLGAGGIREIEFIVQVFQLIRGGREPALRQRSLLSALAVLEQQQILSTHDAQSLVQGYCWLRKLEHALQGVRNEQTQTLPAADQHTEWWRLARIMGTHDPAQLQARIKTLQTYIHQQFNAAIGDQDEDETSPACEPWLSIWLNTDDDQALPVLLQEAGIPPAQQSDWQRALRQLQELVERRHMGPRGREIMASLAPQLLQLTVTEGRSAEVLSRLVEVLTPLLTRTPYLELLQENPGALRQLLRLCRGGRWFAAELARYPILLDELLEPEQLYQPTPLADYEDELARFMLRIEADDLEQQMEALRQFKQSQQLRIAAADFAGNLPLMRVSDHLTRVAEVLLRYVIKQAWYVMRQRHGTPQGIDDPESCLLAVAYGKLGGLELGYGSDLDLVFLHNLPSGTTTGPRAISHEQFLIRLIQKVVHICTTRMPSGVLYEIDLRLRPSGNSGLLVSHIEGFAEYQQQDAWVWEHQALVRTRALFGRPLYERFANVRHGILIQARDPQWLATEIVKMRAKMRAHLARDQHGQQFDLKQGRGGITDIEFIAQYLVLRYAAAHPQMTRYSDNIRIFEQAAACNLLTAQQQQALVSAYQALRNASHRCALDEKPPVIDADAELLAARTNVIEQWQTCFAAVEDSL